MTSRLHFELFMQALRMRASQFGSKQLSQGGMRGEDNNDVGLVRLSLLEAAVKEKRADRADE